MKTREPTQEEREYLRGWRTARDFAVRFSFKPHGMLQMDHVNWLLGEWVEKGILEVFDPQISGVKFKLKEEGLA